MNWSSTANATPLTPLTDDELARWKREATNIVQPFVEMRGPDLARIIARLEAAEAARAELYAPLQCLYDCNIGQNHGAFGGAKEWKSAMKAAMDAAEAALAKHEVLNSTPPLPASA